MAVDDLIAYIEDVVKNAIEDPKSEFHNLPVVMERDNRGQKFDVLSIRLQKPKRGKGRLKGHTYLGAVKKPKAKKDG